MNPSPHPTQNLEVSVLVPTFNRAHYLPECLDSLLAQTQPAREIIVIDDGSQDATPEVLRRYGSRIRVLRKDNGGKPGALNLGLSHAQGALIWVFDDDDVALPHAIASRVAMLQQHPEAGFVYSPHYEGRDGACGLIEPTRLHRLPAHTPEWFLLALMKGCFFHLGTALVRATLYRAVGGFDTHLLSSEDYDMQLRLACSSTGVVCTQPSFIFRQHSGPRGALAIRYSGHQRSKVFRHFDQRVGHKLRASLALGDYLVPRQTRPLQAPQQRQALLNRMAVMASKGCLPDMLNDLRCALQLGPAQGLPTPAEQHAIAEAICTGYAEAAITHEWAQFRRQVAELASSAPGRVALRALALGFWRLAKGYPGSVAVRARRLAQAARLTLSSLAP